MIEFNRILCPIDFSQYSDHALRVAMKIAHWSGASLDVLHVIPAMPPSSVSGLAASARQLAARNLNATVERWREPGVEVATELVESADASEQIVARAEALDVDLIVMGSHGRKGLPRLVLGSVVEPLLHRCRRPMLVIPAGLDQRRLDRPVSFSRIICGIDFSDASVAASAYALAIAEEADATLTLLNVIEMPPELINPPQPPDFDIDRVHAEADADRRARLQALVPEHARDYCTVATAVLEGHSSRQLLRVAAEQHADLIVLGVHGRGTIDLAVFGSNARDAIIHAHCPVLIVPAGPRRGRAAVRLGGRHAAPATVR